MSCKLTPPDVGLVGSTENRNKWLPALVTVISRMVQSSVRFHRNYNSSGVAG